MAAIARPAALRLSADIDAELVDLRRAVEEMTVLRVAPEPSAVQAAALLLHNYYTGVESIFVRISKVFQEGIEQQGSWHRELLRAMALDMPSLRPRVIADSTHERLSELLAFRHRIRNLYSWRIDNKRVFELVDSMAQTHSQFRADLDLFKAFLAQLADAS